MMRVSYEKLMDMKITRTRHKVTLFPKQSANSIKEAIGNVPDKAILTDVYDNEDGDTLLIFEEEYPAS